VGGTFSNGGSIIIVCIRPCVLRLYVCVYVCMILCLTGGRHIFQRRVCYNRMYTSTCVCIYVFMYVCMNVCTTVNVCHLADMFSIGGSVVTYIYIYTYIYMYVYIYIYIYIYIWFSVVTYKNVIHTTSTFPHVSCKRHLYFWLVICICLHATPRYLHDG
jgi:hypothetical protein